MFENVLDQEEVISTLRADIESDQLPPSVLFSGPPGSGKMTAALELARAQSCAHSAGQESARAAWNCSCPSCSRHRSLVHSDLLLLGARSFPEEVPAALELLGRAPGPAASYFFVRAARKLARRFDTILYEGEETRLAKAAPLLRELEEYLDAVAPEKAAPGSLSKKATEAAEKATAACAKLEAFVPDMPPVFMIRNLEFWAHLAPLGTRKTVVIENADRMQESSRNALLKILEEPPESVRFVLVTSRRNAIMTTILSRARTYRFMERGIEGTARVLERVFRSAEPAPSIEAFLAARRPFPPVEAWARAQDFLGAALSARRDAASLSPPLAALARAAAGTGSGSTALARLLEVTKDFGQKDESFASSFRAFLKALGSLLGSLLREEGCDAKAIAIIERISALVRQAANDYETLNRSPGLLAESLLYAIAETGGGR
jgi:DNA polymerase-3 subunit gamma/tau